MLLLNINGKPYMGTPMALSHLTLNDLKCQSQGHHDFEALYLVKEPGIGPDVIINTINRKLYWASNDTLRFDLV